MIDDRFGCQSYKADPSSHLSADSDYLFSPPGTPSDTSARAALAQSTSFCTVGAPLTPIAPTTSPSTLMGNPPPHAAIRASVGIPAKSDGSPWIKLKNSCVETPNRAVYALFCAISMQRIAAPSIRLNALRLPPSSRIATFSLTPISLAFATAASTIFCASSEEMLCFFTTSAIRHLPPFDVYCVLVIPALRAIEAALELVSQLSSIHRDRGASHVRRIRRTHKGDHVSDLLRCCQTLEGHCRDERGLVFICVGEAREHARIRSAHSDYVYPNSSPRDFQCSGLCQSFHRMFAGHINGRPSSADTSIRRRDIDDASAPLWQHHPQFVLHAQQHTKYIGIKRSRVALFSLFCYETAQAFRPGIVDCNIQASETLNGLVHKVAHVLILADVSTDKNGLCSERL